MILIIGWQCADDVVVMLGLAATTRAPWGCGAAQWMCVGWWGGTPHVPKLKCQKNQKGEKAQTNTKGRKKLSVGPIFGAFWCVLELGFLVDGSPLNDD